MKKIPDWVIKITALKVYNKLFPGTIQRLVEKDEEINKKKITDILNKAMKDE